MFNIEEINKAIQDETYKQMEFAVEAIRTELSFPTYENIIKNFSIDMSNGNISLSLELENDFDTEGQDTIRVLAKGGALKKKNGEFVFVPPNMALSKYLIQ